MRDSSVEEFEFGFAPAPESNNSLVILPPTELLDVELTWSTTMGVSSRFISALVPGLKLFVEDTSQALFASTTAFGVDSGTLGV
jgi:hypothetical protein